MNKTFTPYLFFKIAIQLTIASVLFYSCSNYKTKNAESTAHSFIKNEILGSLTLYETPNKYSKLDTTAISLFNNLKASIDFINNDNFEGAWNLWNQCLTNNNYTPYLAECYLIIGDAVGEQDGKTSLYLLQKATELAHAENNSALEYCCLNKTIHVLVSHADDGELNQLIDKLAKQNSLQAHEILMNNTHKFSEKNAANSVYRIASESLYWLGEDSLADAYHKHLLTNLNIYNDAKVAKNYADIMLGVKTFISSEYNNSENYFKSAVEAIGAESNFLNYDLELPYAYIASIYINQQKFSEAIEYMQLSLKTLQQEYYKNIDEPFKLIPPDKLSMNEETYNIISCYLRLQYYYKRAVYESDEPIHLDDVLKLSKYTNQLIKLWFLNAADEQTLMLASKLIKTSNGFVVDIMWKHKDQFNNFEDKIFKLQTEASSFYLNYLIKLRNNNTNNTNYNTIKNLTVELANAEANSTHLEHNLILKRLQLLKLKSELWDAEQYALNELVYNEFTPNKLKQNEAVLKFFKSNSNLYLTYFKSDKKGAVKLNMDDIPNKIKQLKREVKISPNENKMKRYFYDALIKPIENELNGIDNLTILSDEALDGIIFEVLQDSNQKYLIDSYAIAHRYSAKNIGKHQLPEIQNILAFAPGFVKNNAFSEQQITRSVIESSSFINRGEKGFSLAPIQKSIDEVNHIGNLFEEKHLNKSIYTKGNATKSDLIKNLSNKDIIHIATHGISKNEYESGLFFTMNNNDNGFLSLQELYRLNISADLVVLSACKTGVGEVKTGEGIMALPRGFIYAGAKNVIASLWKVHDEKTKDLMVAFYKHLLEDNVSYAEALRLAKLDCINKGFLPVDWAGFVLIGG